jgi:hypothetical protein
MANHDEFKQQIVTERTLPVSIHKPILFLCRKMSTIHPAAGSDADLLITDQFLF